MADTDELFEAVSDNNAEMVMKILGDQSRAINVDARDKAHGLQTLLMRACHMHVTSSQRSEIFTTILQRSPAVNTQDGGGRSCLCHACISEKTEIVNLLSGLEETDPNIADCDGNTPLIYAVRSRNSNVVLCLLEAFMDRGLDVNHINAKGQTALSEAKRQHDSALCDVLVKKGQADVRLMDGAAPPSSWSLRPLTPRSRNPIKVSPRAGPVLGLKSLADTNCHSEPDLYNPKHFKDPLMAHPALESVKNRSLNNSCNSLPGLEEEDDGSDSENLAPEPVSLNRHRRKNSLSMPDLREEYPSKKTETQRLLQSRLAKHPSQCTIEEEENASRSTSARKRRDSSSLPDLRERNLVTQNTNYSDSDQGEEDLYELDNFSRSLSAMKNTERFSSTPVNLMSSLPNIRHQLQYEHATMRPYKGRLNELKQNIMNQGIENRSSISRQGIRSGKMVRN